MEILKHGVHISSKVNLDIEQNLYHLLFLTRSACQIFHAWEKIPLHKSQFVSWDLNRLAFLEKSQFQYREFFFTNWPSRSIKLLLQTFGIDFFVVFKALITNNFRKTEGKLTEQKHETFQ